MVHMDRGSRKVSSLKTTESYVKYGHLSFVFRKQEMIWPISSWLECGRWIWDSGERFTTQNKKTCTPPLKVGQEIAQLSTWSEREREVPKGWDFVRNWPVIKGFVENLERIRISLWAEGSESKIKNYFPFGKEWRSWNLYLLSTGIIRYPIGIFMF